MDRKTNAQLESISVNKAEVAPGETVTLDRLSSNDHAATRLSSNIPCRSQPGLPCGPDAVGCRRRHHSNEHRYPAGTGGCAGRIKQVISELNKLRKNDRLYIKVVSSEPGVVIGGEEFPSLASFDGGSVQYRSLFEPERLRASEIYVREYELPQSKYVIQGQRALNLTVKP